MSLSARAIALRGFGYGALLVALQGFGPTTEAPEQPPSGGGGAAHTQEPHRKPASQVVARRPAQDEQQPAETSVREATLDIAAPHQTQPVQAAGEPPAPVRAAGGSALQAPIAPQATSAQTAAGGSLTVLSKAATEAVPRETVAALATVADDTAAADRTKERQRRIAIALALLMLDA